MAKMVTYQAGQSLVGNIWEGIYLFKIFRRKMRSFLYDTNKTPHSQQAHTERGK